MASVFKWCPLMTPAEFPIHHNAPILARYNGQWFPVVFDCLSPAGFRCYSHFSWGDQISPDFIFPKEIAPMAGNEKAIHTEADVFDLWDEERVEREVKG